MPLGELMILKRVNPTAIQQLCKGYLCMVRPTQYTSISALNCFSNCSNSSRELETTKFSDTLFASNAIVYKSDLCTVCSNLCSLSFPGYVCLVQFGLC